MAKEEVRKYVRGVLRSMEENFEKLEDGEKIKKLFNGMHTFYVSLFDDEKGIIVLYSIFMTRFFILI